MITISKTLKSENGIEMVEILCLSTDTKPTDYLNGSLCLEMDTGDFYYLDGEDETWKKIGA